MAVNLTIVMNPTTVAPNMTVWASGIVTVDGTAVMSQKIDVYLDNAYFDSVLTDVSGNWIFGISAPTTLGAHTMMAKTLVTGIEYAATANFTVALPGGTVDLSFLIPVLAFIGGGVVVLIVDRVLLHR